MAEQAAQNTEAPKRKRKAPTGPRQSKPFFAIVGYVDADGNAVKLDSSKLSIRFTKDSEELVALLTTEAGANCAVVKAELPVATRKSPAAE